MDQLHMFPEKRVEQADLLSDKLAKLLGPDDLINSSDGPHCRHCGNFILKGKLCIDKDCVAFQARKLLQEVG